jgi:ABC-type amino acid transport system permease subunit
MTGDKRRGEPSHPKAASALLWRVPWWLVGLVGLGAFAAATFASSAGYGVIVRAVASGLGVTITVSLIAYGLSILFCLGLTRSSPLRIAREVATFCIEFVRGLPMLVILYCITFVDAPALASEFVATLKDSAFVSVPGVQDITQPGKVYAASTFLFFETYNAVVFFYLILTVTLSLLVRALERDLKSGRKRCIGI